MTEDSFIIPKSHLSRQYINNAMLKVKLWNHYIYGDLCSKYIADL